MAPELVNDNNTPVFLHSRWLTAVRVAWVVSTLAVSGPTLYNFPGYFSRVLDFSAAGVDGAFHNWTAEALRAAAGSLGISSTALAVFVVSVSLLSIIVFAIVGLVIFFRRSDTTIGLLTSFILANLGSGFSGVPSSLAGLPPWAIFIENVVFGQFWGLFFILFTLFPDGRFVPRSTRWLVPAWILFSTSSIYLNLVSPGKSLGALGLIFPILVIASLGSQIYRYRTSVSPLERQQIRWFAAAAAAFGLFWLPGFPFINLYGILFPAINQLGPAKLVYDLVYLGAGVLVSSLLPLSIAMALLRYRLWDLDFIIRRTLLYAVLIGLLGLVYFGSVVLLREVLGGLTGNSTPAIVISTLLIAALFAPLRRRLHIAIDRRFYRQKYDAAQALEAYSRTVRSQVDLADLSGKLVGVVQETVQPESISLWLKKERP